MKAPKITPGPWHSIDNNWETSTVCDQNEDPLAEVKIYHLVTEESQDENERVKEANAQAISAVPDLIAALIEADNTFEIEGYHEGGPTRQEIRAALMKAGGTE